MQGVQRYRWSRCNVARRDVSCMVVSQRMPKYGFTLSETASLLPYSWNILKRILHTSCYSQGVRFLQSMRLSGVGTISSAKSTNFSLKRACVRKLQTLNINYTQLRIKVKFFFQKKWLFQKIGCINPFFHCWETERCSVSAARNRTLLTYSSVVSASPFNVFRRRVTF